MPDEPRSIVDAADDEAQSKAKRDFRQQVTNNIIDMLERGTAPWQKPWDPERAAAMQMPFNPTTDKAYRGGNAVHLLAMGTSRGYEDPRWMTYNQAKEQGWQVRKGEKGTQIEFWQFPNREGGKSEPEGPEGPADGTRGAPLHRVYTVFNAAQIDGVPAYEVKTRDQWQVVEAGERLLAASGVGIVHDQPNRAYYSLGQDRVHLPPVAAFPSPDRYYATALHEVVHATGHPGRLNRDTLTKSDGFGGEMYAKEELRAELGSMFLAAERGIPHDPEQHAAYVNSWIQVLRNDKNEIFRAAKDAGKATEYLLDREQELVRQEPEVEQPLADIITRETSEHVAELDTDNGAVVITEKNTAAVVRELYDVQTAGRRGESPAAAQEQILDGEVDGRRAPNGFNSLAQAASVAERELGDGARTMRALTDSGRYEGPIIGTTSLHVVQKYTSHVAILHARADLLQEAEVDPNRPVVIEYDRGVASIVGVEITNDAHQLDFAIEREH